MYNEVITLKCALQSETTSLPDLNAYSSCLSLDAAPSELCPHLKSQAEGTHGSMRMLSWICMQIKIAPMHTRCTLR